ncbi:WXG100 family type VII secretion target [Kitasatospora sp. NBC_00240]|uniref:WXG100 family type VII secretion target n=1 Tax=Kitasatospora sp. NBC_00240 TaxID=2903567 RepID=UPI002258524C|nr:WXG100 family type VII secretion target [Kitasatospora sp. NBC_00240]MCX5212692.1 WXG100 family type VII secretion target [Kitasatospora sp. NBC_00240]
MSFTDFNSYSHGSLRSMVQAMNSGEVMSASDPWRRAADTLKAIHTSLQSTSGEAALDWEGSSSDAFYSKMTKLANNINNTASYAQDAAETLKHMAQAIDQAKKTMPEEPGLWDQFTDGFGDTVSATFGGDDEDTKTAVTDEKKAQAVAVMQILARKYQAATPVLKSPRDRFDESGEIVAPGDPTGAAIVGLIAGAGLGTVGSNGSGSGGSGSRSSQSRPGGTSVAPTPKAPKTNVAVAPADPAIKGGSAQPAPKPPTPANFGPGTGIDGAVLAPSPAGSGTGSSNLGGTGAGGTGTGHAGSGGLSGGVPQGGLGGIGTGNKTQGGGTGSLSGGQNKAGAVGREFGRGGTGSGAARGGSAFGAGGMNEGGFGGGRGAAGGRGGASAVRRSGGVAGQSTGMGAGSGRKAFTEGGSGLGARARVQAEHGAGPQGGKGAQGQGMPLSDAQRRKKDREKGSKRPDYLVEDEETWVSGQHSNPNVVE